LVRVANQSNLTMPLGLVLKYLKGLRFVIGKRYLAPYPAASQVVLTRPLDRLYGDTPTSDDQITRANPRAPPAGS
jgi:hypothetical protein